VADLMAALGQAEWFEDEASFALAGHLTGAGPAFLFRFIDALAEAGEAVGLPPDQARRLAAAMVEGAGALAAVSAETPAELARRVASPGGTTEAGLAVLDRDDRLRSLIRETLQAATRRGRELAKEARAKS
jgi:pyrroline-5-carboxylate reductase